MVDSIKTPLDRQHVNDNSSHDTFSRNNNAGRVYSWSGSTVLIYTEPY